MRLKLGASVLAAARALDTRTIKDGLRRFEQAHRGYVDAQRKVDAAQSALDAARGRVLELRGVQNDAVEDLARALYLDGYGGKNPFTTFGAPPMSAIGRLAVADAAKVIELLVAAVLRAKGMSKKTVDAAQSALEASHAVEQAFDSVTTFEDGIRDARATRDAIGRLWDSAIGALRRRACAAADEGAPDLYPTLFPPLRTAMRKRADQPIASPTKCARAEQPVTPPAGPQPVRPIGGY
jgi:hypothetical protein